MEIVVVLVGKNTYLFGTRVRLISASSCLFVSLTVYDPYLQLYFNYPLTPRSPVWCLWMLSVLLLCHKVSRAKRISYFSIHGEVECRSFMPLSCGSSFSATVPGFAFSGFVRKDYFLLECSLHIVAVFAEGHVCCCLNLNMNLSRNVSRTTSFAIDFPEARWKVARYIVKPVGNEKTE